jgi:hypothetical protein
MSTNLIPSGTPGSADRLCGPATGTRFITDNDFETAALLAAANRPERARIRRGGVMTRTRHPLAMAASARRWRATEGRTFRCC